MFKMNMKARCGAYLFLSVQPLTFFFCVFFHYTVVLWFMVRRRHFHCGWVWLCCLLTIYTVGGTSKREKWSHIIILMTVAVY